MLIVILLYSRSPTNQNDAPFPNDVTDWMNVQSFNHHGNLNVFEVQFYENAELVFKLVLLTAFDQIYIMQNAILCG